MSTYILQVDTPDGAKAGDEFIWHEGGFNYPEAYYKNRDINDCWWTPENVENNPKFFKLKEKSVFKTFTLEEIYEIIRTVNNGALGRDVKSFLRYSFAEAVGVSKQIPDNKWTDIDMINCFNASRETVGQISSYGQYVKNKYEKSQDYLNTLK